MRWKGPWPIEMRSMRMTHFVVVGKGRMVVELWVVVMARLHLGAAGAARV